MAFKMLKHTQATRHHLYCNGTEHVSVTNPFNPWSGDPQEIALTPCDCEKTEQAVTGPATDDPGKATA